MASRNPFSGETLFELDVHNILFAIDEECFVDYRESVAAWCAAPKQQFPKTLRTGRATNPAAFVRLQPIGIGRTGRQYTAPVSALPLRGAARGD
jgi:hypothetical protein